jgi:hypothetical protein
MSKVDFKVSVKGRVVIRDHKTKEVLVDKTNAIHTQNMSRIIARALANEGNHIINRMAFGNGGTFLDAADNIVYKTPNDGNNGDGWESRLYNETYSEIVDEDNVNFGSDLGSADDNSVRIGGGASPGDDPAGGGVVSEEVGTKSNVVITVFLNENEPSSQLAAYTLTPSDDYFQFDEIGLYSSGKQAKATSGYSNVSLGTKTSEDISLLAVNTVYSINLDVDGVNHSTEITTPASGSGPSGEITYGDICEGINTGAWITSGDSIPSFAYVFITDTSGGGYSSIVGAESYGYLTFQSLTTGSTSTVTLNCNNTDPVELFNVLTSGNCDNVNVQSAVGDVAGIANDDDATLERERLLTHFIFDPILKSSDRILSITYTLTVGIEPSSDSIVNITLP